ncbi:cyclic nucleotide-binding domain-containing protein [Corticibacter populi]|uniref:Cyclic nucleotide-binding domain-containing protein n=1 Tax=Corticibacter populi TaxID=1550736 RepID=A0A3M6QQB2_9BURK|nr:cyclic nucleotide-binding domain-containing protein [Corticibacter populi]RMX04991.1 cyclic nucleotide-binding domain-containing protein [Corticibacter populi]RZS33578.1 cyclic nucleotide-binding protein [Corticibacter populi]
MYSASRLAGLIEAFQSPQDAEAVRLALPLEHWRVMEGHLTLVNMVESSFLFQRGGQERSLYLLESGRVVIHYENSLGKLRMATISPGNMFGEASFLGRMSRQATAQVANVGKVWTLGPVKFGELCNRHPELALTLTQLAATVLAKRSCDRKRRIAIA